MDQSTANPRSESHAQQHMSSFASALPVFSKGRAVDVIFTKSRKACFLFKEIHKVHAVKAGKKLAWKEQFSRIAVYNACKGNGNPSNGECISDAPHKGKEICEEGVHPFFP